jgi:hypothetical protein
MWTELTGSAYTDNWFDCSHADMISVAREGPCSVMCINLTCRGGLPWFGILAQRNDGFGTPLGHGIVTFARVVGAVRCLATVCLQAVRGGRDAGDLLIDRDLAEQLGPHRGVAHIAAGDFNCPNFQCFLVDPEMDLALDTAIGTTVLASVPSAFTLHLDPRAVDQQVQRTLRPPMRDVHGEDLLAMAERAEVWHIPIEADQARQALYQPGRLPQRHAEQHLHGQAGLHGIVAVDGLSPTLAGRLR